MGVPTVMRDVTLWAFTQDFFATREDVLKQFEAAMATLDQPLHCYLAQLHAIQVHDTTARLHKIAVPTMVLAGAEDILIPNRLSKALQSRHPRRGVGDLAGRPRLPVGIPAAVQQEGAGIHRPPPRLSRGRGRLA